MPGGGGYGDPKKRDPLRVAIDVRDGMVSSEAARKHYGVALDEQGAVDVDATQQLRSN